MDQDMASHKFLILQPSRSLALIIRSLAAVKQKSLIHPSRPVHQPLPNPAENQTMALVVV
jgi:hypothetical protein